jgi:hypothetical protein
MTVSVGAWSTRCCGPQLFQLRSHLNDKNICAAKSVPKGSTNA